jgi:predicted NUDIX family phosphoesterase
VAKLDGSERVLCVRHFDYRAALASAGVAPFRGFRPWSSPAERIAVRDAVLAASVFRPRTAELESDPSWRQLIPYGVLGFWGRVFAYRRGAGSEARLARKASVGLGGHVNPGDAAWSGCPVPPLLAALYRELAEEAGGSYVDHAAECVGLIDDDAEPVGAVHLGVVFRVEARSVWCHRFAPEVEPLGWERPAEWLAAGLEWEGWSRHLLGHWCGAPAQGAMPTSQP